MRQEGPAFLGQLEAAGGAAQQRGVQLVLQPAQRAADARDGLAQLLGRGGDGAAVDHGGEGLQFVQGRFHGWHC